VYNIQGFRVVNFNQQVFYLDTIKQQTMSTWSNRTPSVAEPNRVAISPLSLSSWSTKAEDDMERAPPITTA